MPLWGRRGDGGAGRRRIWRHAPTSGQRSAFGSCRCRRRVTRSTSSTIGSGSPPGTGWPGDPMVSWTPWSGEYRSAPRRCRPRGHHRAGRPGGGGEDSDPDRRPQRRARRIPGDGARGVRRGRGARLRGLRVGAGARWGRAMERRRRQRRRGRRGGRAGRAGGLVARRSVHRDARPGRRRWPGPGRPGGARGALPGLGGGGVGPGDGQATQQGALPGDRGACGSGPGAGARGV